MNPIRSNNQKIPAAEIKNNDEQKINDLISKIVKEIVNKINKAESKTVTYTLAGNNRIISQLLLLNVNFNDSVKRICEQLEKLNYKFEKKLDFIVAAYTYPQYVFTFDLT